MYSAGVLIAIIAFGAGLSLVLFYLILNWFEGRRATVRTGQDMGKMIWSCDENGTRLDIKGRTVRVTESVFSYYKVRDFATSFKNELSQGDISLPNNVDSNGLMQTFQEIEQDPESLLTSENLGFEFLVVKKLLIAVVIKKGERFEDYIYPFRKKGLSIEALATQKEIDGLLFRLPKERGIKAIKQLKHLRVAIFVPKTVLIQKGWIQEIKELAEKWFRPLSVIPFMADVETRVKFLEKRIKDEVKEKKRLQGELQSLSAYSLEDSEVAQMIREEIKHSKRVITGAKTGLSMFFPILGVIVAGYFSAWAFYAAFSGCAMGSMLSFVFLFRR